MSWFKSFFLIDFSLIFLVGGFLVLLNANDVYLDKIGLVMILVGVQALAKLGADILEQER